MRTEYGIMHQGVEAATKVLEAHFGKIEVSRSSVGVMLPDNWQEASSSELIVQVMLPEVSIVHRSIWRSPWGQRYEQWLVSCTVVITFQVLTNGLIVKKAQIDQIRIILPISDHLKCPFDTKGMNYINISMDSEAVFVRQKELKSKNIRHPQAEMS